MALTIRDLIVKLASTIELEFELCSRDLALDWPHPGIMSRSHH